NGAKVAEMFSVTVDGVRDNQFLADALRQKFGEEGLAKVPAVTKDLPNSANALAMFTMLREAKIEEKGDTATVTAPAGQKPLTMVRRSGRWYMDLTPTPQEAAGIALAVNIVKA